jgi:hypothetical protein
MTRRREVKVFEIRTADPRSVVAGTREPSISSRTTLSAGTAAAPRTSRPPRRCAGPRLNPRLGQLAVPGDRGPDKAPRHRRSAISRSGVDRAFAG